MSHLFFLVFGQDPLLPVDFLLGKNRASEEGNAHDWIVEQQTRLQVAFGEATRHLQAAASRRKAHHDQKVKDAPLHEGQMVYLRNVGLRGRNKIQDVWKSVLYQVLKAPKEGGSVYTVAPVDDPSKARNVHCSLLKGHYGQAHTNEADGAYAQEDIEPTVGDEDSLDGDFCVVRPQYTNIHVPVANSQCPPVDTTSLPSTSGMSRTSGGQSLVRHPSPRTDNQSGVDERALRRTSRATAGKHPNLHHLPQTFGSRAIGATASQVPVTEAAVFRPWQ